MEGVLASFAQFDNDVRSERPGPGCAPPSSAVGGRLSPPFGI